MAVFSKRRTLCAFFLLATLPFAYHWAVCATAKSIVSPARRPIQPYHRQWLDQPAHHGVVIQQLLCLTHTTPCLLVTPDQQTGPAERGQRLREQLREKSYSLSPYGTAEGTIVLLHGRNGRKEDLLAVAERFCAVGYRCILPDLPAHGESTLDITSFGLSDFDQRFASSVLHEVESTYPIENPQAFVWGMSMGGAFASASLQHAPDRWSAAVIVCSFDALPNVINDKAESLLPFAAHTFAQSVMQRIKKAHSIDCQCVQPAQWLQTNHIPLFIAHGTNDSLISPQRGRSLFQHAGGKPKKWVEVEGANHSNILITPMPLYSEMVMWFLDNSRENQSVEN